MIVPQLIMQQFPASKQSLRFIHQTRHRIQDILSGKDNRFLIIVGPCSIHDVCSALEFAKRLKKISDQFHDTLCIVMRVYIEKSRSTTGWKGFIHDPDLNHRYDIEKGIIKARELLLKINEMGVPTAYEIVNPLMSHYFVDLMSWVAIGARSTESQLHREYASSLSLPVGFKNNTSGNIQVAIDAVETARKPNVFIGMNEMGVITQCKTSGNAMCHVVLRGSTEHANYDSDTVNTTSRLLHAIGAPPHLLIDCSHGNCQKNFQRQLTVISEIAERMAKGDRTCCGVMIESHLKAGKQAWDYGRDSPISLRGDQSITDPCLSFEDTEKAITMLADATQPLCAVAQ